MRFLPAPLRRTAAWARGLVSGRRGVDLRGADAETLQIVALESGEPERVRRVLDPRNRLSPTVAAHAIPLLASDAVAREVVRALQPVAELHAGKLIDHLLDARQPAPARQRSARLLAGCDSQRAVDGLLAGLQDRSPEVRVQCARALLLIRQRRPIVVLPESAVLESTLRELDSPSPDLKLVFTLIALVLPVPAIRSAYRALRSGDAQLRGTAQEYLHEMLRPDVREALLRHIT